ncbi:MAG: patatin-like phospholipase family protein [Anaerolineales bacterium]|nr:patatin-like phospholipase family protein [Anaerolineales bacterium]
MALKFPHKNLVFQGGGIKTFAYHGTLEILEAQQILPQIERVAGTSAGAVLAMLLSFRLSAQETVKILRAVDYTKIPGLKTASLPEWARRPPLPEEQITQLMQRMDTLTRLYRNYGWYTHDYAYAWLMETIAQYCQGNGRATFQEFRERGFRDLYIPAANLSTHRVTFFCADETPAVAVADAVLMSTTLPLFFEALQFDGTSFGQGDYYADGGLVANFPLDLFDSPKFATGNRHYLHGINWETLGCRIFSPPDCPPISKPITNLLTYMQNLIETLGMAQDVAFENSLVNQMRTININDCCVSVTDFHIRPAEEDAKYMELFEAGRDAARSYLEQYRLPTDRFYDLKVKFAEFLTQWR